MKSLKLFLVMAIAASSFTTVIPKKRPVWEFVKKHKGKLAAGVIATAAIGAAAVGLAYHGNRTKEALDKAGITSSSTDYDVAVAAVGLLGPLGETRTLDFLRRALDKKVITYAFAASLVLPKIGNALAYYFGVSPVSFQAKAGFITGKTAVKATVEKIKAGWSRFRSYVTSGASAG